MLSYAYDNFVWIKRDHEWFETGFMAVATKPKAKEGVEHMVGVVWMISCYFLILYHTVLHCKGFESSFSQYFNKYLQYLLLITKHNRLSINMIVKRW